jgi:hypothetical protein
VSDGHSGISGREHEMGALTEAVRRLIQLSVTSTVPAGELEDVAASLNALSDRLEVGLPAVSYPRFTGRDPSEPVDARKIETAMPFDVVVGRYNPIALPVKLEIAPPLAIGRAVFTTPYEGAPGCVHGASIAGTFDIVLTAANMIAGAAGPTVRLALRFRRPTLLGHEAIFEAQVDSKTEKRVHTTGRLIQDGVVTVEATGEFALLDMEQIAALHRR